MAVNRRKPSTQAELIIQCWNELGAESAGARELDAIGNVLSERFGDGVASPAAIARTLADEGVPLRHPEVLDCDTIWRQGRLTNSLPAESLNFTTLDNATIGLKKISTLAIRLRAENDMNGLAALRTAVFRIQQDLELIGQSRIGPEQARTMAAEAATWITVLLQNPDVFEDWLSLRRNSPEFLEKFGL